MEFVADMTLMVPKQIHNKIKYSTWYKSNTSRSTIYTNTVTIPIHRMIHILCVEYFHCCWYKCVLGSIGVEVSDIKTFTTWEEFE